MNSRFCFVIPNYNHTAAIEQTLAALQQYSYPIILVDDGSSTQTKLFLEDVANKFDVILFRRDRNGGKGAAVRTGLQLAYEKGMTHAIQVDADGQHDLDAIEPLLNASKSFPEALISGKPIYDQSISKGRYYGRFLTHFWVYIETLSFSIKDTMCGFRVYPLHDFIKLSERVRLGQRMDFDIEVMVRLFWQGTDVKFVPTKVHYPEDGVSHFHVWNDNWLITKMHTKLVLGMLIRIPMLIRRKFRKEK